METTKKEFYMALLELESIGTFDIYLQDDQYNNLEWIEKQHEKLLRILLCLDKVLNAKGQVFINRNNREYTSFSIDGEKLYIYTVYGFVKNNNLKKFWNNLMLHLGFLIGCEKELKNFKN